MEYNYYITTVLMSFSTYSSVLVSSGLVSVDWFFSSLWVVFFFSSFLHVWWFFYWVLVYSYKYSWIVFWDRLFGNSLMLLRIDHQIMQRALFLNENFQRHTKVKRMIYVHLYVYLSSWFDSYQCFSIFASFFP